jgi:predicted nucleic acid-binding protein
LSASRVYLDSCVLIYLHEGERALRARVVERLRGSSSPDGAVTPCVSDLVRLECRVRPLRDEAAELLDAYERFFALPEVERLPLAAEVFDRATELRARHGLRTPDAIHVACAERGGCTAFWTNDRALAKLDLGLRVEIIE